jgi:hypothetical protein
MVDDSDGELASLLAERAITRLLHRYAQGVDRRDLAQVRSCYWDDATDSHPPFSGSADQYVAWLAEVLEPVTVITHQMTNVLIDVDLEARSATSESYCFNVIVVREAGGASERRTTQCLRYLDEMRLRNGEWRFLRRSIVRDWTQSCQVISERGGTTPDGEVSDD